MSATGPPSEVAAAEPTGLVAGYRCRHCHTRFAATHPSFPRCPGCQKFVITCRNCHWYDEKFYECTNAIVVRSMATLSDSATYRIQDPDVYTSCQEHNSKVATTVRVGPTPRWASALLILASVGAGALALLLGFSLWARPPQVAVPTQMNFLIYYPHEVEQGERFTVECYVRNMEARPSPPVWLRFQDGLFERIDLVGINPAPKEEVIRGFLNSRGRYFRFDPLPANGAATIRVSMVGHEMKHVNTTISLQVPGATIGEKPLKLSIN